MKNLNNIELILRINAIIRLDSILKGNELINQII